MGIWLAGRVVGRLHQLLATLRPICGRRRRTATTLRPITVMDAHDAYCSSTTIVALTKQAPAEAIRENDM
ncbi:MAG: hypothetical protein FJZ83_02635 [Chloroflexi bacterium]|nr:hypothetical protein [Chloroflexota bacterium]